MSSGTGSIDRGWDYRVVCDFLTLERLTSYLLAADTDLEAAFDLYEWNHRASLSALGLTTMVEVVVRNAIDRELRSWAAVRFGTETWFDHVPLDAQGARALRAARDRATDQGRRSEVHGKVIAELMLGFWRYLVESRYHAVLWVPTLHRAFPDGERDLRARRRQVAHLMRKMQFLRNRVAHSEPIHRRDLLVDLDAALSLAAWISQDVADWIRARETVSAVVTTKPDPSSSGATPSI